jgi:hypothetical protein
MKKLLTLLCLLPALSQAQTFVKDTTQVIAPLQAIPKSGTMKHDQLIINPATATAPGTMSAAQVQTLNATASSLSQTIATVNTLNGIVTIHGEQLKSLSAPQPSREFAGTSLTLQSTDNGGTIYCTSGSTVTISAGRLPKDFSCTIIRAGSGNVQLTPSGVTMSSGVNYRRIANNGAVTVRYRNETHVYLSGNLIK